MATTLAVVSDSIPGRGGANSVGAFIPSAAGTLVLDADGRPSVDASIAALPSELSDLATALETKPEIPAVPDAQDVVDALVALGLVTQAAP